VGTTEAVVVRTTESILLDSVEAFVGRYCVLPGEHERAAVALWVLHTWAILCAHATPYLLALSPAKRSGKTRLLETVELIVASPWRATSTSEAALFRKIAHSRPTLLLDEIDAIFASASERTEPLRAILNSGNRPNSTVTRCVGDGSKQATEDFPIYCAKCLAGIDKQNRLPDTIRDRSIPIAMRRKVAGEGVERFRYRTAHAAAEGLRQGLEQWVAERGETLAQVEADWPDLNDRACEAWEPLLAIATLAGEPWRTRAYAAAVALSGDDDAEDTTTTSLLLAARSALNGHDRIATADLLDQLNADDELPFGGWNDGAGLKPRNLARLLKPYGIRPTKIRPSQGGTPLNGYRKDQFTDAWVRYLPTLESAEHPEHAEQPAQQAAFRALERSAVPEVPQIPEGDDEHDADAEFARVSAKGLLP